MNESQAPLKALKKTLQRFSAFDHKMQISTVLTFLEIADGELNRRPVSTGDIEMSVGLQSGTASRNVHYWADGHKDMRGGHEFVSVNFAKDRRRRSLLLTAKGRAFLNSIVSDLTDGQAAR